MNIGIVGCGWLGMPLASELSKNHKVQCYNRENTADDSTFYSNDIIIICINTKDNYLQTLKKISSLVKNTSSIILMSSTSVYKEFDKEVNEKTKITKINLQKKAEDLVLSLKEKVLILRIGGLMGNDRISGKWKNINIFKDGPVNYIHKEDVIGIVKHMINKYIQDGVYNLVAPIHPFRSSVHIKNSKKFSFHVGTFEGVSHKIVSSKKLIEKIGYRFLYPNPLDFWD